MVAVPLLNCGACGWEGRAGIDVRFQLVELPESQRRPVEVQLPASHRAGSVMVPVTVPERYASEPRCRDRAACDQRVDAFTRAQKEYPL